MMKLWRLIKITVICLFIFLWSSPSYALNIENVINPRQTYGGWVTDMASILSDETEKQLNNEISQLESSNSVEIAVVTVPETSSEPSPKSFATKLFNYWGIGKAEENNGVLFLISIKEHRVEIETGLGIQPVIPNSQVAEIIDRDIKPLFEQEEFDLGVLLAVDDLIAELKNNQTSYVTYKSTGGQVFVLLFLLFIFGAMIVTIVYGMQPEKNSNRKIDSEDNSSNNLDYHNFVSGSFDSGSSGSDFGGGFSDGGGGGGSW